MGIPGIGLSEVYRPDLLSKIKIATIFIGDETAAYQVGKKYLTFVSAEGEGNILEAGSDRWRSSRNRWSGNTLVLSQQCTAPFPRAGQVRVLPGRYKTGNQV